MVGVAVAVDGRPGVLLADPGYHVARIVTVMADCAYPHTGWFTQSDEAHCRKEYRYSFSRRNGGYVEWRERETRGAAVRCKTSLVYVARPYLGGVGVTERRNLVYNFRTLLARDQKGHPVAGLYFPLGAREPTFTLFLDSAAHSRKTKYKFALFAQPQLLPESILEDVELCNELLKYPEGELLRLLGRLARALAHPAFVEQVLEINDHICRLCL